MVIGYSGMDPHTAVYVLSKTVKYFISILSEEARTITDTDSKLLITINNYY